MEPVNTASIQYWCALPSEIDQMIFSHLKGKNIFHLVFTCHAARTAFSGPLQKTLIERYRYFPCTAFMKIDISNPQNSWCRQIVSLELDLHGKQDPQLVKTWTVFCAHVTDLKIPYHRLQELTFYTDSFRNLKHLNLFHTGIDTNVSFMQQALSIAKIIQGRHSLTDIYLSESAVSGDTLEYIGDHCLELKTINLSNCTDITFKGIHALVSKCTRLTNINLSRTPEDDVTDETLFTIGMGCRLLETLDLSANRLITDKGLHEIALGCHNLKNLILVNCHKITDKGVRDITLMCEQLEMIALSGCEKITDEAIRYLSFCRMLSTIGVLRCPEITGQATQTLARCCPHIKIFSGNFYYCQDSKKWADMTLHRS